MGTYGKEFYADLENASIASAKEIVPILINRYRPSSVVDVGCGTGAFAREFLDNGVSDVFGYEGEWMRDVKTLLEKEKYVYVDISKELRTSRTYDLCLCLEVAEHLYNSSARTLVSTLTSLSSRVVFSAAIPHQGGNHHVNEQWPEFWALLFAEKRFSLEWDPRLLIWNNSNIASCYRQNLLVFERVATKESTIPLSLVHPEAWNSAMRHRKTPFWYKSLSLLPRPILRMGKKVIRGIVGVVK